MNEAIRTVEVKSMRNTRTLAIAITILIGMFGGWFLATQTVEAEDTKGCEGLADYRVAIFKAGRDYLKALDEDGIPGSRDILTYSSDDWTHLSENVLDYQKSLKDIDAPDWAEPWHSAQIEALGLLEQVAKVAAKDGVFMLLGFEDQLNAADKAKTDALEVVSKSCSDFPAFQRDWDAVGGDIDGTPVATPSN